MKAFLYPFQGKMMPLREIIRYYRYKGIDIDRNFLSTIIRQKADEIGRENITEEIFLDLVKDIVSRKMLATVSSDFEKNCIHEFGQEFWDDLLRKKQEKHEAQKYRAQMRVKKQTNSPKTEEYKNQPSLSIEHADGKGRDD